MTFRNDLPQPVRGAKRPGIRQLAAVLALTSFAVFGIAGCGGDADPDERPPNIVLISVDSLRADRLGCYGHSRDTSPAIDRLANEGVLFEDVSSSSCWTLPAHAALFTGLPDTVHGADRSERHLEPWQRTLAEALGAAGYRTAGVWSGPVLDPRFGFGQGFETYVGIDRTPEAGHGEAESWERSVQLSHEVVTGPRILARVEELLAGSGPGDEPGSDDRPLFLFVHLWDVHYDYIPPAPFDTRFTDPDYDGEIDGHGLTDLLFADPTTLTAADREQLDALYAGEVAWADQQVKELLALVKAANLYGETVTVLTSDHGEELFEHGKFGHERGLYEESIRIPLVLHAPGLLPQGARYSDPVRIVDIAPTLVELAGAEPLPDTLGRSLLPLFRNQPLPPSPVISERIVGADSHWLATRQGSIKVIADLGSGKILGVYDLDTDPNEQSSLAAADGSIPQAAVRALRLALLKIDELKRIHDRENPDRPMDEDLRRLLESLGYLGGNSSSGNSPKSVPRVGKLLRAEPNPIRVCGGSELGTTTLSWDLLRPVAEGEDGTGGIGLDAADLTMGDLELRVDSARGALFAEIGPVGSATTGNWVTQGLRFVLVEKASGQVLDEIRVDLTQDGCD